MILSTAGYPHRRHGQPSQRRLERPRQFQRAQAVKRPAMRPVQRRFRSQRRQMAQSGISLPEAPYGVILCRLQQLGDGNRGGKKAQGRTRPFLTRHRLRWPVRSRNRRYLPDSAWQIPVPGSTGTVIARQWASTMSPSERAPILALTAGKAKRTPAGLRSRSSDQ